VAPASTILLPRECPDHEIWSAFHLGQLPEETLGRLSVHLEQCPACSSSLRALENQEDNLVQELRRQPLVDSYGDEPACREALDRLRDLLPADESDQPISTTFGDYRLVRCLGEGSMGTVYEAVHPQRGRVSLKMLAGRRATDRHAAARFRREIDAVGRLDHPHIVRAFEAGEIDGILYFAMEFVEGIDLARLLKARGPLPVADACELVRQAALGLEHAHEQGLIHRDVKPSNLLLDTSGRVKVLDLGLALRFEDGGEALTSTGQVLGTFDYMAPEQCQDTHAVDARADVYSLGCTLYHLLTGHPPFTGSHHATPQRKLWAHAYESPSPLGTERPGVSPELTALLERLLAKDPANRPATAAEVARSLTSFANGSNLGALLRGLEAKHDPSAEPDQGAQPPGAPIKRRGQAVRPRLLILVSFLFVGVALATAPGERVVHDRPRPTPPPVRVETTQRPERPPARHETPPVPVKVAAPARPVVHPAALLGFREVGEGAFGLGERVESLLFARLVSRDGLVLVDREDLARTLGEAELNLSGAVRPGEATRVGQLTGARLLLTGSVVHVEGKKIHLIAKIIGTETGRLAGASVEGRIDELDALVTRLADRIADTIVRAGDGLVAPTVPRVDRLARLREQLRGRKLPSVSVRIGEQHIGRLARDPAAQTELTLWCKEIGFEVLDSEAGGESKADVQITGVGLSALATRRGNLVSVKARLEVKAVERRTGKVLAVDRQTTLVLDLSEPLAGKAALQQAAATIAERLLPRLVAGQGPRRERGLRRQP
jgi:Protein kinase domain/Curli production assembly/transport component CsgG